jgi:hypothetical protein
MNILFKMITARKNKGLAMQVVPKLIEGWEVKYITGSEHSRFTANCVHIMEKESIDDEEDDNERMDEKEIYDSTDTFDSLKLRRRKKSKDNDETGICNLHPLCFLFPFRAYFSF